MIQIEDGEESSDKKARLRISGPAPVGPALETASFMSLLHQFHVHFHWGRRYDIVEL